MKLKLLAFALLVCAASNAAAAAPACTASRTERVLFIGNSYTYVNNVPRLVEAIAASLPGPCIQTSMIASGGATLSRHWASDSVVRRIREGNWTAVVLQEQSTFGQAWWINGRAHIGEPSDDLAEFLRRFAAAATAAKARPVLLAHWSDDDAADRDQQVLDFLYSRAARATGSAFSPVGEAIKRMRKEVPRTTPYFTDGHHLSAAGSYLEALVLYATLADRSPAGAPRRIDGPAVEFNQGTVFADSVVTLVDFPDAVASALQRIAGDVHAKWRGRVPSAAKPASLVGEFPQLPTKGDAVSISALTGRWRGSSTLLPSPSNQPVTVEMVLRNGASSDSVYLRDGRIEFSGPVSTRVDGVQLIISGTVLPRSRVGRTGPPDPFSLTLRAVLEGATLRGVAELRQPGSATAAFRAIGKVEMARERE